MVAMCLAHAIIFGNEDKRALEVILFIRNSALPQLNKSTSTIISDKDKGLLTAINSILPSAAGFYCSQHRQENIVRRFRSLAASMYIRAVCAVTIHDLLQEKKKIDELLNEKREARYLLCA